MSEGYFKTKLYDICMKFLISAHCDIGAILGA